MPTATPPVPLDWYFDCISPFAYLRLEQFDRPEVKAQLRQNTEQAIALGVFGVPTFVLGSDLFWGEDATPMLLHCIAAPGWLQSDEVRRISDLPVGVQRNI